MILESEPHVEGRASEVKRPEGQWMRSALRSELNTAESLESQGTMWQSLDPLGLSFLFCTRKVKYWTQSHLNKFWLSIHTPPRSIFTCMEVLQGAKLAPHWGIMCGKWWVVGEGTHQRWGSSQFPPVELVWNHSIWLCSHGIPGCLRFD